jgi:hypothetical protein
MQPIGPSFRARCFLVAPNVGSVRLGPLLPVGDPLVGGFRWPLFAREPGAAGLVLWSRMSLPPASRHSDHHGNITAVVPNDRRRKQSRSEAPKHSSLPPEPDLPVPTVPDRPTAPGLLPAGGLAFFPPLRARKNLCVRVAGEGCRFHGVRSVVLGASVHLGGGVVRPNSARLADVARPWTFRAGRLCVSRPEA